MLAKSSIVRQLTFYIRVCLICQVARFVFKVMQKQLDGINWICLILTNVLSVYIMSCSLQVGAKEMFCMIMQCRYLEIAALVKVFNREAELK